MYNKKNLLNNNPPLRIKKLVLGVIGSLALGQSLHANSIYPENTDNNSWNCQRLNGLWHCSAADRDNTLTESQIQPASVSTVDSIQEKNQDSKEKPIFTKPIGPTGGIAVNNSLQYKAAERSNCSDQIEEENNQTRSEKFFNHNNKQQSSNKKTDMDKTSEQFFIKNNKNSKLVPDEADATESFLKSPPVNDGSTRIEADEATASDKNIVNFNGDVVIKRNQQQLLADKASYNKSDELFTAHGNVKISQPGADFQGDSASYQIESKKGKLQNSSYQLIAGKNKTPAQGRASNLQFEPGLINMTEPTFSSCPANSEDWVIKTSNMKLYTDQGYGEGKHAVAYFKGVPFFYTPYIQFPLNDKRKSGFLLPEIAYSSKNGADLSTPFYWNIAPNMDATITPRLLSKRGLMLGSEFRYLGESQYAEIYADYLNDSEPNSDRNAEEIAIRGNDVDKNRGSLSFQHHASLTQRLRSHINFNYATDNYFIDDFGNNLKDRSVNQLLREGRISYANRFLNFSTMVQGYQELRQNINTYSRLPQVLLSAYHKFEPAGIPLGAGFSSEAVMFVKNWDFNQTADEGQRYNIRPYIDFPLTRQYGFIKPRISLDMVQYSLDETEIAGAETDFNRTIPIFSLDSGLFFEKELSLFNTGMTQTLEPRLFYLYVPHEEQNNQPLFDTTLNHFTFNQLFRENRFSGIDRLGDANQLSIALTSRLFDNTNGYERLRASIGQIVYFDDREVQLNSSTATETDGTSAIATEIASQFLPHWNTSFSMMYDPHNSEIDTSTFRLQYKSDAFHIVNFDYTYKTDGTEAENYDQIDLSAYWKVTPRWRALARWNYSMQDNFSLESMLGLEYDSCCYAMRLVASREQAYETEKADNRLMLQMQFKGLASIGNISDSTLANAIPGFEKIMDE